MRGISRDGDQYGEKTSPSPRPLEALDHRDRLVGRKGVGGYKSHLQEILVSRKARQMLDFILANAKKNLVGIIYQLKTGHCHWPAPRASEVGALGVRREGRGEETGGRGAGGQRLRNACSSSPRPPSWPPLKRSKEVVSFARYVFCYFLPPWDRSGGGGSHNEPQGQWTGTAKVYLCMLSWSR